MFGGAESDNLPNPSLGIKDFLVGGELWPEERVYSKGTREVSPSLTAAKKSVPALLVH